MKNVIYPSSRILINVCTDTRGINIGTDAESLSCLLDYRNIVKFIAVCNAQMDTQTSRALSRLTHIYYLPSENELLM